MTTFQDLGLSPAILRSLAALGFDKPTPIQSQAIPLLLQGHDLLGLAQTGTGKTAAFGLPLVQLLAADGAKPAPKTIRSLILAPTRELVNQIAANLRTYVRGTPLRINLVVGGASINVQCRNLERGTDILVATPGRLIDLVERQAVFLDSARFLVLDEADQMLDLGFIHALRRISKLVGQPRQTMLFSATMPKQIEDLGRAYLTDPVRVEVSPPGKAVDKIRQSVHFVNQRGKAELLRDLLAKDPDNLSLVFARTKHGAEKLMKFLVASGYPSASIHGNKSQ
ncbi:MAG: DEAD/DEAH box helicase, partial [Nitratireductor sp.]|nr:DEAD/DEAH box helicase [Nitratireductor sp.]